MHAGPTRTSITRMIDLPMAAPARRDRRHPAFFPAMSLLLAAIVFYGFAPTYYLRPADAPAIPVYLHLHGAAMTAWFSLLIVQTALIASGRRTLHRRLGIAGVALGLAVAALSPAVVVWFVPGLVASGTPMATAALIVIGDLVALLVFAILLVLAVRARRQPETHARLVLLASIPIVAPALGRASLAALGTPLPGVAVQMSLPFLVVLHDLFMLRRVHRATIWGTAAVVGSMMVSIALANSPAGPAVIRFLHG